MYIAPNTNVKILRDIKLDSSYRNTAYWECFSQTSLKKRSMRPFSCAT